MKRRGFSLFEMVVAVGLLAVLLGLGVGLTRKPSQQGEARSLAEKVAGELRTAREQAVAEQIPVAVGFVTRGLYRANGEVARLQLSRRFDREYPLARLFWEVSAVPRPGWATALPDGPLVVFSPTGQAVSNLNGGRLAACLGVGPGEIFSPYTVAISAQGQVSVARGWEGLSVREGQGPVGAGEPAPAVGAAPVGNPQILSVAAFPEPNPATLPADVDNTVRADGFLTFAVEARAPQPLTIEWRCPEGGQCSATPIAMRYDAESASWKAHWEWRPPSTTRPGDRYHLSCQVRDEAGGGAETALVGATGTVEVLPPGRLVFSRPASEIWAANPDGSDLRLLGAADGAVPSPDGNLLALRIPSAITIGNRDGSEPLACFTPPLGEAEHLAWHPHGNLLLVQTVDSGVIEDDFEMPGMFRRRRLFLVRPNGDNPRTGVALTPLQLANHRDAAGGKVSWHPGGSKLAYTRDRAVWIMNLDADYRVVANAAVAPGLESPLFSPDGNSLAMLDASGRLLVAPYGSGSLGAPISIPAPGPVGSLAWSPDGTRLVFVVASTGDIYESLADGTGVRSLVAGQRCVDLFWGR